MAEVSMSTQAWIFELAREFQLPRDRVREGLLRIARKHNWRSLEQELAHPRDLGDWVRVGSGKAG
jgi:hypothetical protein